MNSLKAEWFYIKNNKSIIFILLIAIYIIVLPLCVSIIMNSDYTNKLVSVYTLLQRILIIPSIVLHSYLYSVYVDQELKEVVLSLDRGFKYKYCVLNYIFIQTLHLPFYVTLILFDSENIYYLGIYCLQVAVLITLYYILTKFINSSFACLSLIIVYIMLFTLLLFNIGFGNIFLINVDYREISKNYYYCLLISYCVFLFVGYAIEKRILRSRKKSY